MKNSTPILYAIRLVLSLPGLGFGFLCGVIGIGPDGIAPLEARLFYLCFFFMMVISCLPLFTSRNKRYRSIVLAFSPSYLYVLGYLTLKFGMTPLDAYVPTAVALGALGLGSVTAAKAEHRKSKAQGSHPTQSTGTSGPTDPPSLCPWRSGAATASASRRWKRPRRSSSPFRESHKLGSVMSQIDMLQGLIWSGRRGLNPRPSAWEAEYPAQWTGNDKSRQETPGTDRKRHYDWKPTLHLLARRGQEWTGNAKGEVVVGTA